MWLGASATVVEEPNSHVYGAIWELDVENMKSLDRYIIFLKCNVSYVFFSN